MEVAESVIIFSTRDIITVIHKISDNNSYRVFMDLDRLVVGGRRKVLIFKARAVPGASKQCQGPSDRLPQA